MQLPPWRASVAPCSSDFQPRVPPGRQWRAGGNGEWRAKRDWMSREMERRVLRPSPGPLQGLSESPRPSKAPRSVMEAERPRVGNPLRCDTHKTHKAA